MKKHNFLSYLSLYVLIIISYWLLVNFIWESEHYLHLIVELIGFSLLVIGSFYILYLSRTESKKIEKQLESRVNEFKQYKAFIDLSLDGFYALHPKTLEFFFVSKGAYRQLGYDAEKNELLGKTPLDIDCSSNFDEVEQDLLMPLLSGNLSVGKAEALHKRKDGSNFPVEVILQSIELESYGQCFIAVTRDISARKEKEILYDKYKQKLHKEIERKTKALEKKNQELIDQANTMTEANLQLKEEMYKRRQTEMALRESEERFSLALQASTDGLWDWDIETNTVYFSPQWKAMRGYAENELSNQLEEWSSRVHPDDIDQVMEVIKAHLDKKTVNYESVHRVQHKDGYYIWITDTGIALWDKTGKPYRMVGSEKNINAQKQAEEALLQKEAFLRLMIDNIPHLIFWKDINNVYLGANKYFAQQAGYDSGDALVGKKDKELWPKHIAEAYVSDDKEVIESNQSKLNIVEQIITPNGDATWFQTSKVLLHDSEGFVIGILGIAVDITNQKQIEQALKESEERFALALKAGNDGLWDWNLETNTLFFSKRWKEMIGYAPDELADTFEVWQKLVHPDDIKAAEADITAYLNKKSDKYENIHRLKHKDGHYVWILDRGIGLENDKGEFIRFTGTHTDISLQKQAEDVLSTYSEKLEKEVAQQTQALHFNAIELEKQKQKFTTILDSLEAVIYVADMQTYELLFVNEFTRRTFGSDWQGQLCWEYIQQDMESPCDFCTNSKLLDENGKPTGIHKWEFQNSINNHWYYLQDRAIEWEDGRLVRLEIATDITPIKEAEQQVRVNEMRFRGFFEQSLIGMIITSLDKGILQLNDRLCEIWGYSREELIQMDWTQITHPDDLAADVSQFNRLIAGEMAGYNIDKRFIRKDGSIVHTTLAVSLIQNNNENADIAIIGLVQDISERKQIEQALKESEERFSLAMRGANDGLWDWDLVRNHLYFSPRWKSMLGYEDDELDNAIETWQNQLHPDDLEMALITINDYFDQKTPNLELTFRMRHKQGHYVWILSRGYAVWNAEGKAIRAVGTHVDISERKAFESSLREKEELLKLVINNIPQLIFWKDRQSRFLGCNDSFAQTAGANSVQELLGKTDFDLHWKDMASKFYDFEQKVMQQDQAQHYIDTYIKTDGEIGWVDINKVPLHNSKGEVIGLLGTAEDITERKKAEAELQLAKFTMENSPDIIEWFDPDANFIYVNDTQCKTSGYTRAELLQMKVHDIDPNFPYEAWSDVWEQLKQEGNLQFESTNRHKDGTIIQVEVSATYLNYEGKEFICSFVRDITERKKAETELQLAKFSLENSPDLVEWFDPDANFIYVNNTRCEVSGYTRAELLQMKVHDIDPNFPLEAWPDVWKELKQKGSLQFETTNRHKEGTIIQVEVSATYLNYEGKEFICSFVRDITERKKAEAELHLAKFTMENSPDAVIWAVADASIIYANQTECKILDYSLEELLKLKVTHVDPNFQVKLSWDDVWQQAQKEELQLETLHQRKDGSIFPIEVRGAYLNYEGKEFLCAFIRDITERKKAEQAIQEANTRFDLVNQAANEGLWDMLVVDPENPIGSENPIWYSPKLRELLGYEGEHDFPNLITSWSNALHPDDKPIVLQLFSDHITDITGETSYNIECRLKIKAGKYRWFSAVGTTLRDDAGLAIRMAGSIRDISERKQGEEALKMAIKNAETARKQAEIANQAKSTFLANMSHELRTPLNGILGYTQILNRDQSINPKQLEGINIIQRSGEYLLTLINDILDLSKIEADKVELYPIDIHFSNFLQGIVELFQMRAEQKGISFIYEPITLLPDGVRADEKRLRQVLINLLANAVKFTETGGVCLRVGYRDEHLRFEIEDTGMGIPEQDLENIFLPFHQSGDKYSKAEGTGLGLSITKRIIEMMDGQLHVKSVINKGSLFWFEVKLPEVSNLMQHKQEEKAIIVGFEGETRRVLVVDDKSENRSVLRNLLTPLGFEIIEASNGQEGLDLLHQQKIDIVLTDLVMPVMDGFELSRRIRAAGIYDTLPIIAVSASVFDYHQKQSVDAGCNEFIPKPIRADVLLDRLQHYLQLTWVYNHNIHATTTGEQDNAENITNDENYTLSADQAAILYDLAMQGDTMGLIDYAQQLSADDNTLKFFAAKITQLAENFEDEQICDLIEPYREI